MIIYLIGMMGAGKSTFGKQLATYLNFPFVDLDEAIVQHEGKTIAQLFETLGENGFRLAEQKVLQIESNTTANKIIATGGGTPCFFDNMAYMNTTGCTLFLNIAAAEIANRLSKANNQHRPLLKDKSKKSTKDMKGEIEELVSSDGSMTNSKIPILDPRLHPKKTMDQTVAASRITNDPISRGYRTYYGESVEEVSEEDMSAAFGYAETSGKTGPETYKYYKDELEMEPDEAKDRTEQQGKDPFGKRDKKSKFKNDPNFVSRQILPEIQKQKAIKMLEDMLAKKKNSSDADITEKEKEVQVSNILKKNIKSIRKQMDKEGLSKKDILKLLDDE